MSVLLWIVSIVFVFIAWDGDQPLKALLIANLMATYAVLARAPGKGR